MTNCEESPCWPDLRRIQKIRRRTLAWFRRHARDLPWRASADPYRVWISEVMLQQTQVVTVVPYYERFPAAFPDAATLACAPEASVLRLWEGLGYYRRARQLHRAAKVIVADHGGVFPREVTAVQALPGIGRYTAGAITSIAFDARQPILEANTLRLFSRLLAYRGDCRSPAGQALLWKFAEAILPAKHVGTFNQGLMEIGSTICKPRDPDCPHCPLASLCPTQAHGWQDQIPKKPRPTVYESVEEACVVVRRRDQVLLRQCGADERWAGLWDFPRFPLPAGRKESAPDATLAVELARQVRRMTGITIVAGPTLTTIKHGVTRYRITLTCFEGVYRRGTLHSGAQRWVARRQLGDYPLSVTGRKIARLLT